MAAPVLPSGFAGAPTPYPVAVGAHSLLPTSLHGSVEAAIVVAFLFALGWCFCLANFRFTKYVGTRTESEVASNGLNYSLNSSDFLAPY